MGCAPPKDASVVLGPERIANASVRLAIWAVCARISVRNRPAVSSYCLLLTPRYTDTTTSAAIANAAAHHGIPARSSTPTEAKTRRRSWREGSAQGALAPISVTVSRDRLIPAMHTSQL